MSIMSNWVYERVLSSKLGFSLHGLRYRLPEGERSYWAEYIGKRIMIDDEYKRGVLRIDPRRVIGLSNSYVVTYVRGGYAWLRNDSERVEKAEMEFLANYCKAKGWDRETLTLEQAAEITESEGYERAGELKQKQ